MGDNLYWMITITDRNQSQKFLSFYKTYGIEVVLSTLGKGTAASEILNDFGLEATQKAVLLSVVTGKVWSAVQKGLQTIMLIDIPGTGIAFTMPLSSIGGKRQLEFLTNRLWPQRAAKSQAAAPSSTQRAPAWRERKSSSAFPSPVKKSLCSSS